MAQKKRSRASVKSKRAGRGSSELENYERAVEGLERALKSFHKGDIERAKEQLEKLRENHRNELELMDRVQSYLTACEARLAPTRRPKSPEEWVTQGIFELNAGNGKDAIKAFTKALEEHPDKAHVNYCLAAAHAAAGDASESAKHLKAAIGSDPTVRIRAKSDQDFASVRDSDEVASLLSA